MNRKQSIEKLRQVLLKRRQALRKALAGELSELEALNRAARGDEVDMALDSAYDEMNAQLAEIESRELAQIEKALERMEDGTYGTCELTGKQIPLARLQALPYTTVRVEAQRGELIYYVRSNGTDVPERRNRRIVSMHLVLKATSPTLSTSSTSSTSGSMWAATENPSRTYIPDE